MLEAEGFRILEWEDKSRQSLEWFRSAVESLQRSGPRPLGLPLLMGKTAKAKFENTIRNLEGGGLLLSKPLLRKRNRAPPVLPNGVRLTAGRQTKVYFPVSG